MQVTIKCIPTIHIMGIRKKRLRFDTEGQSID